MFEERTSRIIKNLPYIAIVGALIAAVASMKIFAGSEVSIFTLEKAYSAGVTPEQSQTLINQAALAEFMRGLGFVPLIATTALATVCMQLRALPLFMRWAISPNPMVAAVLGAVVISAESCCFVRSANGWSHPSVRNASDNIRNAMNMLMEVALLVGSIFAAIKMAGYTGFYRGCHLLPQRIPGPVGTENGGTGRGSNDHRYSAECSLLAWPVVPA